MKPLTRPVLRWSLALSVLLSWGAALAMSTAQAELYSVTDLGLTASSSFGINDAGQVVGSHFTPVPNGFQEQAFLYSNGTITNLGTLGGTNAYANSINSAGQVVGVSGLAGSSLQHAFLYSNGSMTDLGTLPQFPAQPELGSVYGNSQASGINDAGQVVGTSAAPFSPRPHAFLYTNGSMTDLGTLANQFGAFSSATGVNNGGQVVGYSLLSNSNINIPSHAFLYSNGTMTDLGTLAGGTSTAMGINNAGQVVGFSSVTTNGLEHAFLYNNGTMSDLGTLAGGLISHAYGINDSGQVVGYSATVGGTHAFVYHNGLLIDLNSLLDSSGTGWTLTRAAAINNNGQIVGLGTNALGQTDAFLLTPVNPVPLPGAVWLFGSGLLMLLGWQMRAHSRHL